MLSVFGLLGGTGCNSCRESVHPSVPDTRQNTRNRGYREMIPVLFITFNLRRSVRIKLVMVALLGLFRATYPVFRCLLNYCPGKKIYENGQSITGD